MSLIPAPTIVCYKNGEEVERELDYVEEPTLSQVLSGVRFMVPKLLPGEEVRYAADGKILIIETGGGQP